MVWSIESICHCRDHLLSSAPKRVSHLYPEIRLSLSLPSLHTTTRPKSNTRGGKKERPSLDLIFVSATLPPSARQRHLSPSVLLSRPPLPDRSASLSHASFSSRLPNPSPIK